MSNSNTADQSLAALQEDVAALKRDLGQLLARMTSTASTAAHGAASDIQDRATRMLHEATAEGGRSFKAIGHQVEEQPVLALLVVLGLGYLGGRLLSR